MSKRRELEAQIHSLGEIKEIMNAMKNLSLTETHRLSRFLDTQRRVVSSLESAAADFLSFHPHLIPREEESRLVYVLVGSERGFCGDFNESLVRSVDREIAAAEKGCLVVVGNKLSTKLAGDARVAAFVDGPNVAEEAGSVLTKLMEALSGLNTAREGPLRITVFHHRAGEDDVSISLLRPFREADGGKRFGYPPLLNVEPHTFLAGLAEQYLAAMLYELLYSSLMAENQRRMQHMDSAVQRLDRTMTDLLLRRNTMRQGEITEEIEIIMLSIGALNQEHGDYEA